MDGLLFVSVSMLWLATLIQFTLTLRVVRWLRITTEATSVQSNRERRADLILGAPAPDFKARTMDGERVTLDDYAGRSVVFVFVSPHCAHCRYQMPKIVKLTPLAKRNADTEVVIISDSDVVKTGQWLDTLRQQDHLEVTSPVLVAPRKSSDFVVDYNPKGAYPFFCAIDRQGLVQVRDWVSGIEWNKLERTWEGLTRLSPLLASRLR